MTFPATPVEQALIMGDALAASFAHTQDNLAGQLAERSQRIYQNDVAAFLWWLRTHLAGEAPGRYEDCLREGMLPDQPKTPRSFRG